MSDGKQLDIVGKYRIMEEAGVYVVYDSYLNNRQARCLSYVQSFNTLEDAIGNAVERSFADFIPVLYRDSNGTYARELCNVILRQHRTHQQSVMRTLHDTLHMYGERADSDLRNQDAVTWCQNLFRQYFPFL